MLFFVFDLHFDFVVNDVFNLTRPEIDNFWIDFFTQRFIDFSSFLTTKIHNTGRNWFSNYIYVDDSTDFSSHIDIDFILDFFWDVYNNFNFYVVFVILVLEDIIDSTQCNWYHFVGTTCIKQFDYIVDRFDHHSELYNHAWFKRCSYYFSVRNYVVQYFVNDDTQMRHALDAYNVKNISDGCCHITAFDSSDN